MAFQTASGKWINLPRKSGGDFNSAKYIITQIIIYPVHQNSSDWWMNRSMYRLKLEAIHIEQTLSPGIPPKALYTTCVSKELRNPLESIWADCNRIFWPAILFGGGQILLGYVRKVFWVAKDIHNHPPFHAFCFCCIHSKEIVLEFNCLVCNLQML